MRGAGGAERSLAAIAGDLCTDVDLHVITFTGRNQLGPELVSAGATLSDVGAGSRARIVRSLAQRISDLDADIVHTTLIDADVVGRVAAMVTRTPVVSSLVNVNHDPRRSMGAGGRARRIAAWGADAASARCVVRFHALTEHVATTMSRRLLVPRRRIDVVPRGRSPTTLGRRSDDRRDRARNDLGVTGRLVVAAARHEPNKGLDTLVRAISLLPSRCSDVTVAIAGREGTETERLRRLVDDLEVGDRVRWLGQRDDVAELMCAADVWCVPSRWEGLASILIEAMALEVPVVASAVPAIREVAGDPPVFRLVAPEDPVALAEGVADVLDDPDGAAERARRAYDRFLDRFTTRRVAEQMIGFYERALDASRLT
jgi:glycosyltransferase involved in cell wall biosynthesis